MRGANHLLRTILLVPGCLVDQRDDADSREPADQNLALVGYLRLARGQRSGSQRGKNRCAVVSKHGVSLADAAGLEWETALSWPDQRQAYGEDRFCAIGYIGLRLFVVVYTDREGGRRVISLRKANKREVERYAKA